MIKVTYLNGGNEDYVGTIPLFLDENNPKSATEQINDSYQHGGGWRDFNSFGTPFTLLTNDNLQYPGDPPYVPRAEMHLRDETILVYDSAWVAVIQPDRSFEVSRID